MADRGDVRVMNRHCLPRSATPAPAHTIRVPVAVADCLPHATKRCSDDRSCRVPDARPRALVLVRTGEERAHDLPMPSARSLALSLCALETDRRRVPRAPSACARPTAYLLCAFERSVSFVDTASTPSIIDSSGRSCASGGGDCHALNLSMKFLLIEYEPRYLERIRIRRMENPLRPQSVHVRGSDLVQA